MSGHANSLLVIPYFSPLTRTTCYVVAPRGGTGAILVDPVHVDNDFFSILLKRNLEVRWVLITQPDEDMRHPLSTLCRIFEYTVIAGESELFRYPCRRLRPEALEEEKLEPEGISINAIPFLPHSRNSYVYHLGDCLFTGSIVHAGTLGETPSSYNEELLVATVKDHLFTIPQAEKDLLMLPSVGPPSTIRAEMHLSPFYRDFESNE